MGGLGAVMAVVLQLIARVGLGDTGCYDFSEFSWLERRGVGWTLFFFLSGQCPVWVAV